MEKNYNHKTEDVLYKNWKTSGKMRANSESKKKPFTITLPPPNVTGQLHLGHAAMLAIEDIMIRFKKMTDHEVLWVPGTDHAAIATENVVLKHLGTKSREQYGREEFLGHCREFATEKHDTICNQMEKMGAWLDWSRESYTFDDQRNFAVNKIFKSLYEDGLIVRGHRMINWSIGAQSVISDDELEYDEVKEPFYYIKCGKFVVGTVRPETKCANSPVVVHPDAEYVKVKVNGKETYIVSKYLMEDEGQRKKVFNLLSEENSFEILETFTGKELEGQEFEYETYAGKRKFHVIADSVIDPHKGSGAMTISCNHSADDYNLGKRLNLEEYFFDKIDMEGKMTDVAGPCARMSINDARIKSGKLMEEMGLLTGKDKHYQHRVPLCYRSGCVVEPMISPQWFIAVEKEFTDKFSGEKTTLKKQMQEAVREKHVKIIPEKFEKEYFRWIDNLRDWCISRQIWWGHRIPVWYDEQNNIHLPEEQKIIFARHGETESGANGIVQGATDSLNPSGIKQAEKLAEKLKDENITKIITSGYARAAETAEIIGKELGIAVEILDVFNGYDYGDVVGEKVDKTNCVAAERAMKLGTGETIEGFWNRMKLSWAQIKKIRTKGKLLVVGHRTNLCALDTIREGRNKEAFIENRRAKNNADFGYWGEEASFHPPQKEGLTQDEDTLDTWFSSALWPFSTVGWPQNSEVDLKDPKRSTSGISDYEKFYPNSVLETGWDILFFWVARMIMFGKYATGKYPFHTVYLHGMVTDEHGKKMSKSKGNGIDPLDMIGEFGADPVRLALVIGSTPGQKIPIGENKIKGYRNFVNKLWNAGRFVEMQLQDAKVDLKNMSDQEQRSTLLPMQAKSLAEKWILAQFAKTAKTIKTDLENYQISAAGDKIYHFVWNDFCDWFIEASKVSKNPAFLSALYGEILKLVHPLCPFVTEQIWEDLFSSPPLEQGEPEGVLLLEEAFPSLAFEAKTDVIEFEKIQQIVNEIRSLRADNKLNPKEKLNIIGNIKDEESKKLIESLAGVRFESFKDEKAQKIIVENFEILVQIPVDEGRKQKEIDNLKKEIAALEGRLENKNYVDRAPEKLVNDTKETLRKAKEKLEKINK